MKWEEVRKLYPNQYVKLNILDYHIEDDKKIVTDVALINVINDSKLATKELLKSRGNTIVYHTGSEKIVIEMRNPNRLKGYEIMKLELVQNY
ncbi:hypothetical protein [Neobacillus jeddahensis]|uniref:hypothetical protein n=1 Tax=Neobacillus jeddahensis TaxID=1461580 RepID=UPI00059147F1|nr:hypothetical protein [Neobacillus jeddahensis]